jgi:hypothetical protein
VILISRTNDRYEAIAMLRMAEDISAVRKPFTQTIMPQLENGGQSLITTLPVTRV